MFFSVIVPVYNTKQYLCCCIDSLLNQSYDDYEIILVDDGSTDGSALICDSYSAEFEKIKTYHKSNGGLVSARKYGALKARGEYIVNIDSDDYVTPDFLNIICRELDHYKSDCICFGYSKVDSKGGIIETIYNTAIPGLYKEDKLCELKCKWLFDYERGDINYGALIYGVCLKVVKSELYKIAQQKVLDSISVGEDTVFTAWLLINVTSIEVLEFAPYMYRISDSSMVRKFNVNSFDNLLVVLNQLADSDRNGIAICQVPGYCFHRLWNLIILCAKSSSSYLSFLSVMKNKYNGTFENYIDLLNYSHFPSKIKHILIKRKAWLLVYIYAHYSR